MIEEMPKDKKNEIKLIFVWNLPKMAKCLDYSDFQSKILPILLKNLKSKNRFIKQDTYGALGETLNALLDKSSTELTKMFDHQSQIFKVIEIFFQLPTHIKKFKSY